MDTLYIFIFEVLLCLGISFLLIILMKPVLREVLIDTCGTKTRAEFWVMFTQVMIIISPLLIVIYFTPAQDSPGINMIDTVKDALFRSLLGDFIAMAMIGQVIWSSVKSASQQTEQSNDNSAGLVD